MRLDKIEIFNNFIVFICLTIIPLIFVPVGKYSDYFYLPKVYVLTVVSIFYLFVLFYKRNNLNDTLQFDIINKVLSVYFTIITISLFFATNLSIAVYGRPFRVEGYSTIIVYFVIFLAARSSRMNEKLFLNGILVSALLVSAYGILQYFGIDPFPRDYIRVNWNSAFSTLGNQNFLGSYLVLMIPFSIHSFIIAEKRFGTIVYSVLLFCLLCTQTRGAWIGAIIGFICYSIILLYTKNRSKPIMIRQLIIVVLSLLIILSFNQISDGSFMKRFISISTDVTDVLSDGENAEKAGSFRFFIWKRVIEMIKEKPFFGFGIENLAEPFVDRYEQDMLEIIGRVYLVDKTHNEFLHIAVTSGIPSLIVYLFFVFKILIEGLRRLKFANIYWPLIAAVLGYLSQAFFNISVVSVAYILWIFMGLITSYKGCKSSSNMEIESVLS